MLLMNEAILINEPRMNGLCNSFIQHIFAHKVALFWFSQGDSNISLEVQKSKNTLFPEIRC